MDWKRIFGVTAEKPDRELRLLFLRHIDIRARILHGVTAEKPDRELRPSGWRKRKANRQTSRRNSRETRQGIETHLPSSVVTPAKRWPGRNSRETRQGIETTKFMIPLSPRLRKWRNSRETRQGIETEVDNVAVRVSLGNPGVTAEKPDRELRQPTNSPPLTTNMPLWGVTAEKPDRELRPRPLHCPILHRVVRRNSRETRQGIETQSILITVSTRTTSPGVTAEKPDRELRPGSRSLLLPQNRS